jgi:lipopolysaccharide biosynthesis glycosyltransferase
MAIKNPMHLALNFERNYLTPFYVFLTSVFENNKENHFVFHVLASGLSEQDKTALVEFVESKGSQLILHAVPEDFAKDFINHGFSRSTFYRLLFNDLLPKYIDRFLYIDVDIVVIGDLSILYNITDFNFPVAAVAEPLIEPRIELGLGGSGDYFNAGVLLINRKQWKEQKISEKAVEFLKKYHHLASYADQDALNAVLSNNWHKLDPKFNLMSKYIPKDLGRGGMKEFINDKIIIHYTHSQKPWHSLCSNRLRFLYYKYFRLSPVSKGRLLIDFKPDRKLLISILKIRTWELYYDYPIINIDTLNSLRSLVKK